MPKHGKKYRAAAEQVDQERAYLPDEAIDLLQRVAFANFDESIEVHARLGIDPRQADQTVRSTVVLPHGTGKQVRVLVFAAGDAERIAREAGADYAGTDELVQQIQGGWLEFDAAVAMADQMGKVGRLGRILGPRGLMPNPRAGTVTPDVARAVSDIKGGKVEYRVDRHGNLHLILGKTSFPAKALVENYQVVLDEILRAKPAAAKGRYIKGITVATSMGPGIKVDPGATRNLTATVASA